MEAEENAIAQPRIFANCRVITLDPNRPRAEAVGTADGRIRAVGSLSEVRQTLKGAVERDLGGAVLVPGLADAHGHLGMLGARMEQLDLSDAESAEEVARRVAARAVGSPPKTWIIGRGWDDSRFAGGRAPDRALLDAAAPHNPVFLERTDAHAAWVSSEALRLSGVGSDTADPPGGRIVRATSGLPSGVLIDEAMKPVAALIPPPTEEQLESQLLAAARRCASVGLTCIHDAGTDLPSWRALQKLAGQGRLPIRVYAMAWSGGPDFEALLADGPCCGLFEGRLSLRAVKLILDGALGSRGAALFEDYSDEPGQRGLLIGLERLSALAPRLLGQGFQLAIHAIGDRAVAAALDVLEQASRTSGAREHRSRIEHVQVLRPEDRARFERSGIIASLQPTHATDDMRWVGRRLGVERLSHAYPLRSLLDAGARLALSSDFPIEDPNPLLGLYAAITRQDRSGQPPGGWYPAERISALEALRGFTEGAALASFSEREQGRIVPGMRADLTALDVDPLEDRPEQLLGGRASLTVVGGEPVFSV